MPRLGLTMVEGTVVEWKAEVGEAVEKGQILLVIESEKVEVEVEAFNSGTLAATYVDAGETVPIGSLLAAIAERGESFDREGFAKAFVPEVEGAPAGAASPTTDRTATPTPSRAPTSGVKAAPAARAAAKKLGVDLKAIAGTGPGGRITVEDVERAASSGPGLSVDVEGSGSPLLFICGFGVDKTSWRRQSDSLKASFTVIAYDHRGIGASRDGGAHTDCGAPTSRSSPRRLARHAGRRPRKDLGADAGDRGKRGLARTARGGRAGRSSDPRCAPRGARGCRARGHDRARRARERAAVGARAPIDISLISPSLSWNVPAADTRIGTAHGSAEDAASRCRRGSIARAAPRSIRSGSASAIRAGNGSQPRNSRIARATRATTRRAISSRRCSPLAAPSKASASRSP